MMDNQGFDSIGDVSSTGIPVPSLVCNNDSERYVQTGSVFTVENKGLPINCDKRDEQHKSRVGDDSKAFLPHNGTNGHVTKRSRVDEKDPDMLCGVGSCTPGFMQICNNMASFTCAYSAAGIVTSALSMYVNSQITTLEKHFNFSSSVSGIIMSCNDFGYLLTTLVMSFYARRVHIPRALALSTVIYGLSGLLCTIAFFGTRNQIPPPPTTQTNMSSPNVPKPGLLCEDSTMLSQGHPMNSTCGQRSQTGFEVSEGWRDAAIGIIGFGMVIQGMAKSPRNPFLGTYVDDNVPRTKTTLYLGIMTGLSIFGPALAFTLGGYFTKVYVTLEATSLTPRDPRWIGAWWLGFLLFGALGLLAGLPLMFYPKRMNRRRDLEAIRHKEKEGSEGKPRLLTDLKEFFNSMKRLVKNPIYVMHVSGHAFDMLRIAGYLGFIAKNIETQFGIPAWKANVFIGALNVSSASVGTVIGGWLTSRFKIGPLACLKMVLAASAVSGVIGGLSIFVGCEQPVIYKGADLMGANPGLPSMCAEACHCKDEAFFPTCGSDGRNYFSPCHAGCTSQEGAMTFTNCTCIPHTGGVLPTAEAGLCTPDCGNLYPFISLMFVGAFISTLVIMPGFIVMVRSVPEADKPLAIGLNAFVGVCLGWFPGPVIFGALVDTTCVIWKTTCSGGRGACSLYDIEMFRNRFYGAVVVLKVVTLVFQTAALLYAIYSKKQVFQPHDDTDLSIDNPQNNTEFSSDHHTNLALTERSANGEMKTLRLNQ